MQNRLEQSEDEKSLEEEPDEDVSEDEGFFQTMWATLQFGCGPWYNEENKLEFLEEADMIEVLFGESEAASMKAAKSTVIAGHVNGPTSVWATGGLQGE